MAHAGDQTTFSYGRLYSVEHERGNWHCPGCSGYWYPHYPRPCAEEGCPGLEHAHLWDEDWEGNYWLDTMCDTCGERE